MSNGNKNTIFIEANVVNISANFQLCPLVVFEEMIFEYFFSNLAFQLPWQPIKFRGLDKNVMMPDYTISSPLSLWSGELINVLYQNISGLLHTGCRNPLPSLFGLISVLLPFNTFQVISGMVSYPNG